MLDSLYANGINYRQDIVNSRRGVKSTDLRTLSTGKLFQDDVLDACSLLTERGWLYQELQIVDDHSEKRKRWGFVFAYPPRLQILQKRGWYTQFDATHNLNEWGHNIFSFLVCDEYNVDSNSTHSS